MTGAANGAHASYSFKALLPDGSDTSGQISAESRDDALVSLQHRGWYPTEVRVSRTHTLRSGRLPVADLALGLRVFATLLGAGLSINKTLAAFADVAPESWTRGIAPMQEAIRTGMSFAEALRGSQLDIPAVVVAIIHAGEAGSGVASAAGRAADVIERSNATRDAVRAAVAYPILLAVAGSLSIALLVGVVLPRFAAILTQLNQSIPRSTRIVMGAATTARTLALPGLVCGIVLLAAWRLWTRSDGGRVQWHAFLLSLPLVGKIRRSAATSRASVALSSLLDSGVPLATALAYASRASGDAAEEAMLLSARELIVHGERPSVALSRTASLTPSTVRLVRAGEESGRLAQMLEHAAKIEANRTEQAIRAAVRLLEPTLIMCLGGVVALIAAALLQAIYSIRPGG
jgi:general secretion pathway protein F